MVSQKRHREQHFTAGATVRDIVLGMSDGLTVPFALAAGLSGAIDSTRIIMAAGLAEIAAGSISMGLGGYLAAKSEWEHFYNEKAREEQEIVEKPEAEMQEVVDILEVYGLASRESRQVATALRERPKAWIDFMMRFELGLEEPAPRRAMISAATIAGAYMIGGLIPLAPYMVLGHAHQGFRWSVVVTLLTLSVFGYIKGFFTGTRPLRSGLQTLAIGGAAAAAAYAFARLVS